MVMGSSVRYDDRVSLLGVRWRLHLPEPVLEELEEEEEATAAASSVSSASAAGWRRSTRRHRTPSSPSLWRQRRWRAQRQWRRRTRRQQQHRDQWRRHRRQRRPLRRRRQRKLRRSLRRRGVLDHVARRRGDAGGFKAADGCTRWGGGGGRRWRGSGRQPAKVILTFFFFNLELAQCKCFTKKNHPSARDIWKGVSARGIAKKTSIMLVALFPLFS